MPPILLAGETQHCIGELLILVTVMLLEKAQMVKQGAKIFSFILRSALQHSGMASTFLFKILGEGGGYWGGAKV